MQIEEVIIGILNDTRDKIRANMEDKNINATGRTSLSIRVRKLDREIQLVGGGNSQAWGGKTAPFESIEIGRGAGGDYKELRPAIYFWTIAKGMDFKDDSHRWAVSTNIAKNIVVQGTRRHRQHEDVYSTEVKEAAERIRKELFEGVFGCVREVVGGFDVESNTNL